MSRIETGGTLAPGARCATPCCKGRRRITSNKRPGPERQSRRIAPPSKRRHASATKWKTKKKTGTQGTKTMEACTAAHTPLPRPRKGAESDRHVRVATGGYIQTGARPERSRQGLTKPWCNGHLIAEKYRPPSVTWKGKKQNEKKQIKHALPAPAAPPKEQNPIRSTFNRWSCVHAAPTLHDRSRAGPPRAGNPRRLRTGRGKSREVQVRAHAATVQRAPQNTAYIRRAVREAEKIM